MGAVFGMRRHRWNGYPTIGRPCSSRVKAAEHVWLLGKCVNNLGEGFITANRFCSSILSHVLRQDRGGNFKFVFWGIRNFRLTPVPAERQLTQ